MPDLAGPKVSARREGTADQGGGRLELRQGRLWVQGSRRARDLGPAADLASIALHDADGTGATLTFAGGASWSLEAGGGGLAEFARSLQVALGRAGLVQDPPTLSMRVRAAATPETRRSVGAAVLVLAGTFVIVVGGLYARDKSRRADIDAATARREATAQNDAERRERSAHAAEEARVSAIADALRTAIDEKRWRTAQALHADLSKTRPDHPMLRPAWASLAPALAALDEQERLTVIAAGIAAARVALADPVRCDDAAYVGEAWRGLGRAQRGDATWTEAVVLAPQLERCRALVAKAYTTNAAATLRGERRRFAAELPDRLRAEGLAVIARIGGRADTELTVEVADLDQDLANDLATMPIAAGARLIEHLAALGMRRVRLTNGDARKFDYALDPPPIEPGVARALAVLGLDKPLVLGDASDLPKPTKKRARRARAR